MLNPVSRAARGLDTFAACLREAWKALRLSVGSELRQRAAIAVEADRRTFARPQGQTGREWGKGSHRYNVSVWGR